MSFFTFPQVIFNFPLCGDITAEIGKIANFPLSVKNRVQEIQEKNAGIAVLELKWISGLEDLINLDFPLFRLGRR